jgi:hypothetical protein
MEMRMSLGAIHVHSNYSDGEFTLAELRRIFVSAGCCFLCTTDHAEAFDKEKLGGYISECQSLSDEQFQFIPGLEYECESRIHILGYGVTSLMRTKDPVEVIRRINDLGGISVIAHPPDWAFESIESFGGQLRGIEVWNSKYDGRYAPRPGTFQLLHKMRECSPDLHAYYGLDLHWKRQFRELFIRINSAGFSRSEVLEALSSGNYCGVYANQQFPSSGRLPSALIARFATVHGRSSQFRRFVKRCMKFLDQTGLRLPVAIKAQLRRLF